MIGCHKEEQPDISVLKKIYMLYENGEISTCIYKDKIVYKAAFNAYDAGFQLYDSQGNLITDCNVSWGQITEKICDEIISCEVIYRIKNNVWGETAVDTYRLGG